MRTSRLRDDAGFTLVELLISIVILGIITAPLAAVVMTYFKDSAATSARLSESHDAQIAAAYFAQDVQALGVRDYSGTGPYFPLLQSVETGVPAGGGSYPCGAPGTPAAVVRLAWDDFGDSTRDSRTQDRVAYVVEGTELHRIRCEGSAAPVSDVVIAHDLSNPFAGVACATQTGAATSCTGTGTAVPSSVSLTLTIHDPQSAPGISYTVTLTGQRRQS